MTLKKKTKEKKSPKKKTKEIGNFPMRVLDYNLVILMTINLDNVLVI